MSGSSKLAEVETYLGFAAVQRQQHCQQILAAIDAVNIPVKVLVTLLAPPACFLQHAYPRLLARR